MKVILASPTIFFLSLRFAVSPPCRCPSVLHLFPILFAIIVYNCLSVYFGVLIFCCYFAFHFVEGEVAAVKIICLKIVTKSKIYWVRLWNCMERCLLSCTVSAWSKFWFIIVSVFFSAFCWCFLPRIKSTYFLPVWIRLKISVVSERSFFLCLFLVHLICFLLNPLNALGCAAAIVVADAAGNCMLCIQFDWMQSTIAETNHLKLYTARVHKFNQPLNPIAIAFFYIVNAVHFFQIHLKSANFSTIYGFLRGLCSIFHCKQMVW